MTPGSEQAYKQCIDDIKAMPKNKIVYCNQPMEIAVNETTQLALATWEDRADFVAAGINQALLDSITRRAGAFAYAAALYQLALEQDPETKRIWDAESPAGYELRRYLLRFMSLAFRDFEELMRQIAHIKEGRGHKDMVLDLLSLNILCEKNMALLAQIPMFDREKVTEARDLHNKLNDLLARSELDANAIGEAKDIYHRAWSYYKEAADEIKIFAQFLYEGTDKHKRYLSDYFQDRGKEGSAAAQKTKAV
ncbi:hypothetical protein EH221_04800, partial [bacterium]